MFIFVLIIFFLIAISTFFGYWERDTPFVQVSKHQKSECKKKPCTDYTHRHIYKED